VKYLKDVDTAREIVQEVFLNLWEKKETIEIATVNSYLKTSVYNRSLNYLRNNRKFNREILEFEHISNLSDNTGDILVAADMGNEIRLAINELPDKCREIFIMSRFKNMKYNRIAEELDISVKTVEAQMSKALKHLRFRLAEYLTIIVLVLIEFFEKHFK